MKNEIKKAKSVFSTCAEFSNCTKIAPLRSKTPESELKRKKYPPLTSKEYLKIMDENFGSCKNPGNPYNRVQNFVKTGKLDYQHCGFKDNILKNFQEFDE